ncbi:MAG: adenylate/guanylate cyclase domain-containing protein [Pseudomonadota bacterium]
MNRIVRFANAFGASRVLALVILVAFIALRLADPAPLQSLRMQVFDIYQMLGPRDRTILQAQPVGVAIIDLDEASLDTIGQWPWPRTILADLVDKVTRAGALAMAFDVLFAEPDRLSPAILATSLEDLSPTLRSELEELPANDERLGAAFARGRVIVGEAAMPRGVTQILHDQPPKPLPVATRGPDATVFLPRFEGLLRNLPVLEQTAIGNGVITILPERDAIVRRVPSVIVANGVHRASLGLEMLRVATGGRPMLIRTDQAGINSVVVGGVAIPTDRNGRIWVRFTEFGSRPDYIPAKDILNDSVDPKRLANKLVFVGTSATGLLDIKTTPLDPAMPGVEVHAQLIETILSQSFLIRPHYAIGAELGLMVGLGVFLAVLLPFAGALASLTIGAVLAAAVTGGSWYGFMSEGLLIDVIYPLAASFVMFMALVFYNYYQEERRRQQIRGAFQQYLSPDLVEQLAQNPDSLVLGGESRTMTVMFSDVRGFTSISESFKDDPQGLTSLMNRFLTPLSNAIMDKKGTIDKYMGDAIMAFWNAPLNDPDHCKAACQAALDMLDNIETINAERRAEARESGSDFLPLDVGIGVNTGLCVVGNMGSDTRFDYSVLGDSVNLASRLEGQSKTYGVRTIIGEATAIAVRDSMAVVELDLIRVKGKLEPEHVFALVGDDKMAADPDFQTLAARNDSMLTAYRKQDWAAARAALSECQARADRFDLADFYTLYETRIADLQADPPGVDWDGVFVATTK